MAQDDTPDVPFFHNNVVEFAPGNLAVELKQRKYKRTPSKAAKAIASGDIRKVMDSLTPFQLRFAQEYVKDFDAKNAAIRAGSTAKHVAQMAHITLKNQAVRITVDHFKLERAKHSDITKDYVLKGIKKVIGAAEQDGNHAATLRGLELLAKHLGMFVERTEISGPDGEAIKMEQQQRVEEDIADFTRQLASLSRRNRAS